MDFCGCCTYDDDVEMAYARAMDSSELNWLWPDYDSEMICNLSCGSENLNKRNRRFSFCFDCVNRGMRIYKTGDLYLPLHYLYATGIYQEIGRNMCEEVIELMNK